MHGDADRRYRAVEFDDRALAVVPDLGADGWHRLGRRRMGMAAAVANRWFAKRNGLAMGLLTAANAAGQLIFLPLLAMFAQRYGWRGVSVAVMLAVLAMVPVVAILLPEWPANIGLGPYGAAA